MIPMKVGNQYVIDARKFDVVFFEEQLRAFPTIDQKILVLNPKELRSLMSIVGESCRVGPEDM
jgi:hypothetical protein